MNTVTSYYSYYVIVIYVCLLVIYYLIYIIVVDGWLLTKTENGFTGESPSLSLNHQSFRLFLFFSNAASLRRPVTVYVVLKGLICEVWEYDGR